VRVLVRPIVTVGVADEGIAGAKPAITPGIGGDLRIVIVAVVHDPWRLGPKDQLSDFADTDAAVVLIDKPDFDAGARTGRGRGGKDAIENTIMDDGECGAGVMQDVLKRRPFQGRIDRHIDRAEITRNASGDVGSTRTTWSPWRTPSSCRLPARLATCCRICAKVQRSPPSKAAKMSSGLARAFRSSA
jgi:hypothetical protein